ncbi:glycosyltransferase [Solibacillus sp.]|uniref:glycosyltransferase n=1 Tax=Solibacillus sp. TaxID=1909654 RepID=UPI0033145C73
MKIALICPSNMLYMPYVKNYEQLLIEQNIDYDIINWDRFQMEEVDENTYRDEKKGHQRNFLDYIKYTKFLFNKLNVTHYDKIIVFGIQLSYFLKKLLLKNYKGNYVIDIRDYNKILHFFNIAELIRNASYTVLSSPGYQVWLPNRKKYLINHNTHISNIIELKEIDPSFNKEKVSIANIGAIRDFSINQHFVDTLKNSGKFVLNYHGEGDYSFKLIKHLKNQHINNVFVTGRYKKEDEGNLYLRNDLINVLRYSNGINNKTALPNRLYNAMLYGKPLVAFNGTYLAKIISKYNLGYVIQSMDNVENELNKYLNEFDRAAYEIGRTTYIRDVIKENNNFKKKIQEFIMAEVRIEKIITI